MTDFDTLLRSRRSIRQFTGQCPSRKLVEELIELAITAPSASNNQPWRFFVSDQRDLIEQMAVAVERAVDQAAQGRQEFRSYGDYFVRFRAAPVVIVPAFRPLTLLSQMAESTPEIDRLELYSGLASTSLAVQNLLLAAHHRGLGASCMTGPLLAAPQLERMLGIPKGWNMALLIALGYAAEEPSPSSRKSPASVLRWVEKEVL